MLGSKASAVWTLVEKMSEEKGFAMRASVEKESRVCGIFTFCRRDKERHEGGCYFDSVDIITETKTTRVMM